MVPSELLKKQVIFNLQFGHIFCVCLIIKPQMMVFREDIFPSWWTGLRGFHDSSTFICHEPKRLPDLQLSWCLFLACQALCPDFWVSRPPQHTHALGVCPRWPSGALQYLSDTRFYCLSDEFPVCWVVTLKPCLLCPVNMPLPPRYAFFFLLLSPMLAVLAPITGDGWEALPLIALTSLLHHPSLLPIHPSICIYSCAFPFL